MAQRVTGGDGRNIAESGDIWFFYRPRVGDEAPGDLGVRLLTERAAGDQRPEGGTGPHPLGALLQGKWE